MWEGFLLGLATGATCLAYCSPVLLPFLLGEAQDVRRSAGLTLQFLGGRLLGYLLFAVVAWWAGQLWRQSGLMREAAIGGIYVLLALLLLAYGRGFKSETCAGQMVKKKTSAWPATLGLLTGLNLCPPFFLAFAAAAQTQTLRDSLLYFFSFFIGTSLYFLPLPLLGFCRKRAELKTIGRLAALVAAVFYLYRGILMMAGGLIP